MGKNVNSKEASGNVEVMQNSTGIMQIFNHPKFGNLRITDHNGNPWFVAKDVAKALGYSDPADAVRRHCKKVNKISQQGESPKRPPVNILIIPESDVYRLIMRSKLPEAEKFEAWVVEEILPTIRKTGGYEIPQAPAKQSEQVEFPIEKQAEVLRIMLEAAQLSPDAVALGINSMTRATTGKDLLALSGTTLTPPIQDVPLTPTEIGNECYDVGPKTVNKALANLGLQRRIGKHWIATEKGKRFSRLESVNKAYSNGTPVVQLKWYSSVIPKVKRWIELEYGD